MEHNCSRQTYPSPKGRYLAEFEVREEPDGTLWLDVNTEYEARINFCPFCGYEAKNKDVAEPSKV